jgi:hypothetical protein
MEPEWVLSKIALNGHLVDDDKKNPLERGLIK